MTSSSAAPSRADVRRRGRVYAYRTLRPEDGYASTEIGYVGQTRQTLRARDGQHRECQPWEDIIVGQPFLVAEGWWVNAELDAAEQEMIRQLCPRYNIADGGIEVACHIPQWTAREQRWARDDAAERPRWVAPEDRPAVPSRRRPVVLPPPSLAARARAAVARRVAAWWSRVWPWVAGWTAAAVAVSAAWLVWVDAATVPDAATIGPVVATGLVGWVASRRKPKRRSRTTNRRKRRAR